jgi:hypothetical protein
MPGFTVAQRLGLTANRTSLRLSTSRACGIEACPDRLDTCTIDAEVLATEARCRPHVDHAGRRIEPEFDVIGEAQPSVLNSTRR